MRRPDVRVFVFLCALDWYGQNGQLVTLGAHVFSSRIEAEQWGRSQLPWVPRGYHFMPRCALMA
jgi:hypothetical protein